MSDLWYIIAKIEHVGERRIIIYEMDVAQERARPNFGDVCLWHRDACEQLLKRTRDKKDKAFIEKEIEFLKEIEDRWRVEYKKW